MKKREDIRNVAIIAHVDHGKTTLVDSLLKQSGIFRDNQVVQDRVMDSNDLEKERGITILAKNTAVHYKGVKINIIDTPGHADFGGEVERVLKMTSGVVLLVDSFEGPMPQTKFVLKKALDLKLPVVVCINKIDRPDARCEEVVNEILDLFIELDASDSVLDSPFVYASAKQGYASLNPDDRSGTMEPLFDLIINHIPAPNGETEEPMQVLISTIDYNDYVGKIGIGRVERGIIKKNDEAVLLNALDKDMQKSVKITKLFEFDGLDRIEVESAKAGSIIGIAGIEGINIGDTIASPEKPEALSFVKISEPTISMTFSVNDSPFAGQDGEFVTSRQLRTRLFKETQTDVSLRVEETDSTDSFKVSGRGELHLSVLIERMRREGYEFQISKPEVLYKNIGGKKMEPMEITTIDVPSEYLGSIIEKLGKRKGELKTLKESNNNTRAVFLIPSRGLIGYKQEFLTDTKGTGIMNTEFSGYEAFKGEIPKRKAASIISFDQGEASAYALNNAQGRGTLFINPGEKVYEGMVVGLSLKGVDLEVSCTRLKKQSNVRAAGSDEAVRLSPPWKMSLEEALEFIETDELIEITPHNMRIRKKILDTNKRYKSKKDN